MRKFAEIFFLEMKSLVRSKALAMLTVASVAWMLAFPHLVKGDGTAEGAHELYVHFSLGGVFALLIVALLASATGSLARERAEKRLQLTMVRPVCYFSIALGKIAAHVAAGAAVLAVACATLSCSVDCSRPCNLVRSPVLPSPREEAKTMYEAYMNDPATPEVVKRAKKQVVLRLLENRAVDNYQVIATNDAVTWQFEEVGDVRNLAVRMRFTNQYEMRQEVRGEFLFGTFGGTVSNLTQAVVTVPLETDEGKTPSPDSVRGLSFVNRGATALMLRPRKDLHLLVPADAFGRNLLRAYVELVAILAFVFSFGVFLSAGLGRPVALFVAFVLLLVSEMSPSVVEQYPDELETNAVDRLGLCITRAVAEVTRPVSALSPLEALAKDECVELPAVLRLAAVDLVFVPVLLSLLAAFALPRKQDDQF